MKGIRKLFLGLILLTLFGVAFKVDAKAAPAIARVSLEAPSPTWGVMKQNFTADYPDVKNNGESAVFKYDIQVTDGNSHGLPGGAGDTSVTEIELKTSKNATGEPTYEYRVNGGSWTTDTGSSGTFVGTLKEHTETQVSDFIQLHGTGDSTKTVTFSAVTTTAPQQTGDETNNSIGTVSLSPAASMNLYKVTLAAKYTAEPSGTPGDFPSGATPVVFNTTSPFYLLPNASKTVTVTTTPGKGYTALKWTENGSTTATSTETLSVKMTYNAPLDVVIVYGKNEAGIRSTDLPNSVVATGTTGSDEKHLTISGYTNLATELTSVKLKNGSSEFTVPYTLSGTTFSFRSSEPGTILTFYMNDGQSYSFPVSVINAAGTTFTITDANKNQTAYVGQTTAISPVTWSGIPPASVSYTPQTNVYYDSTVTDKTMNVTGKTAGSTTVTVTPHYNIEGYTPSKLTDTFTLTVKTVSPVEFTKNIFVNKGSNITVKLKDFLKYDADTQITVTNNSGGLVSFTPSSGANAITSYLISGLSKGTKDKGVTITPGATGKNEANVTVYPEPTISVETSSTSSSTSTTTTYAYTITMPKGVYHDEPTKWVDDLKKAILIFKSSSSDGKTKEVVFDSLEKNDDYSKKQTKKIDVKTITGYLRDICKSDEETVSVWACAVNGEGNNDDKIKTDSKDLKVYKIVLDTNGNKTSYTVNGDTVYDYFYKIDGVEYTVVAKSSTGTGKVDKKNSVNADSATESTGTATIKLGSSGSGVAGERKIKVAFSASNTPADDGSGSSDGYDDQPKTGESKADIWILWTVLFISILGAGFMIWKRFGLVRAIAEADEQVAAAEYEEKVTAAKKEKEDKIKMLKDLRNL